MATDRWMDNEDVVHKYKCHNISHMWNLKYDTNELIYKTDSQTGNRLVVAKGAGGWGRESRSLELADANYYTENGSTRPYCREDGNIFNIL